MKDFRRFSRCSSSDSWLLVTAALFLGTVRLGLWVLPFRTMLRLVALISRPSAIDGGMGASAERIAWAVRVASRFVPVATCLTQALTTQVLLSRRGLEGTLRIGVAKGAGAQLQAHAWIERHGHILVGNLPNLSQFVALPTFDVVAGV